MSRSSNTLYRFFRRAFKTKKGASTADTPILILCIFSLLDQLITIRLCYIRFFPNKNTDSIRDPDSPNKNQMLWADHRQDVL